MTNTAKNIVPEGFTSLRKGGSLIFQSPSKWNDAGLSGRMVHGTFEGLTEKDNFGKENYKFTALEDGITINSAGEETEYAAGATIIINHNGSLASQMEGATEGQTVIVDYDGKTKILKGKFKGKDAHNFTVYVK